jgi:hypothetical protein
MKLIDWVAILGALAWSPHLVQAIRHWLTKSKVRVITQRQLELGFTTYGSILNLRLAFSVENKDLVISDLKIRLTHESGEERLFEWQGITQHMGKMTLPDASAMPFEKEQSVLAIKLNETNIEERFVRFQDPAYLSTQKVHIDRALKKMAYLKEESKYNAESFLREPEMTELYSFNKHAFAWKPGKYSMSIEMQSPEQFNLTDNIREFTLSPLDIERMEKNKDLLEADYRRITTGSEEKIAWQWCNPSLAKLNKSFQRTSR